MTLNTVGKEVIMRIVISQVISSVFDRCEKKAITKISEDNVKLRNENVNLFSENVKFLTENVYLKEQIIKMKEKDPQDIRLGDYVKRLNLSQNKDLIFVDYVISSINKMVLFPLLATSSLSLLNQLGAFLTS